MTRLVPAAAAPGARAWIRSMRLAHVPAILLILMSTRGIGTTARAWLDDDPAVPRTRILEGDAAILLRPPSRIPRGASPRVAVTRLEHGPDRLTTSREDPVARILLPPGTQTLVRVRRTLGSTDTWIRSLDVTERTSDLRNAPGQFTWNLWNRILVVRVRPDRAGLPRFPYELEVWVW